MLRPSRHPYQATTLPQPHLQVRNPWVEKPESSTNSSCGSRSGRIKNTLPQPNQSEWLLPKNQTLSHRGPLLNQQVHPVVVPTQDPDSAISIAHGSSPAVSANGGIGSCGGQCIACETFCYYCLQVIFIAGILTGIALTIAGSVLHGNQKEGDLVVLMYIGVLLVLVCTLLLSVHCCVRRNVRERKRALRVSLMEGGRRVAHPAGGDFTSILIHEFATEPPFRNSFVETNLNDFNVPENPRPLLNIIPNPSYQYQYGQNSLSRPGGAKVNMCERRLLSEVSERQPYEAGRNFHFPAAHRSFR